MKSRYLVIMCVALALVVVYVGYGLSLDGDPVIENVNMLPARSGTTPTAAGKVQYNTTHQWLAVGDGSNTRAIPSGHTVYVMIPSPQLLSAVTGQPIWNNRTGTTFVITTASCRTANAGTTCDVKVGANAFSYGYDDGLGTAAFMAVPMTTVGGVSVYVKDFTSGSTKVPPDFPVNMRYGGGSAADWLEVTLGGYLDGNR